MKHNTDENMKAFEEYLQIKGYSKASRTIDDKAARQFITWATAENIEAEEATYNDILAYVQYCKKKGHSQSTVRRTVGCLKHYFASLVEQEYRDDNPASNIEIKGVKRRTLYEILSMEELETTYRNFTQAGLAGKRNKNMLGLIIYQGLNSGELDNLTPQNLRLREGKIHIQEKGRSNERELKLESHQIIDLSDYVNETRKFLLAVRDQESDKLFVSTGRGDRISNMVTKLFKHLQKQNPKIKDVPHLRTSVITGWLKQYDLRKVQYMIGHKYVSSTEQYQINNLDDLKEDISKYHPINEIKL